MKCRHLRRMLALWNVPTRGPSWLYAARFRQLSPRPHQVLVAWISVYYLSGNMSSILIWFSIYSTKPDSLVEFCWTWKNKLSRGDMMEDESYSDKITVDTVKTIQFLCFFYNVTCLKSLKGLIFHWHFYRDQWHDFYSPWHPRVVYLCNMLRVVTCRSNYTLLSFLGLN